MSSRIGVAKVNSIVDFFSYVNIVASHDNEFSPGGDENNQKLLQMLHGSRGTVFSKRVPLVKQKNKGGKEPGNLGIWGQVSE